MGDPKQCKGNRADGLLGPYALFHPVKDGRTAEECFISRKPSSALTDTRDNSGSHKYFACTCMTGKLVYLVMAKMKWEP